MKKFIKIIIFFILYVTPLFFVGALPYGQLFITYSIFTICLAFINLGDLIGLFANIRYARGRGSKTLYRLAILKDTTSPTAYLNYAVLLMKNNDFVGALPHLKNARSINNQIATDKNIALTLSICYMALGDIDYAITTLIDLKEKYGYLSPSTQAKLGYMYFLKKDIHMSTILLENVVETSPGMATAWDNLGQVYFYTNQFERAIDAFKQALSIEDDLIDSYYHLGLLYENIDKLIAKKYFAKAFDSTCTVFNTTTLQMRNEKYTQYHEK